MSFPSFDEDEDVVINYQFESRYSSLGDVKAELEHPDFSRTSKGVRGLVSTAIVSEADFNELEPWEIPGLPFDFGDGLDIKDATAMLTNDWLEKGLALPDDQFSLKQVNDFLRVFNKRNKIVDRRNALTGKMNRLLGQEFYLSYQWMDIDERVLTDKDILFFLEGNDAVSLVPNMAPWPCTIVPRDHGASVKYLSIFKNGVEFVARTVCERQTGVDFFTDISQIFSCAVCGDLISTPYHVYVFCYIYKQNHSFERLQNWKNTWLRACYLHWKISGVAMPSRNLFADARSKRPRGAKTPWRGRGSRRGSCVRSLFS